MTNLKADDPPKDEGTTTAETESSGPTETTNTETESSGPTETTNTETESSGPTETTNTETESSMHSETTEEIKTTEIPFVGDRVSIYLEFKDAEFKEEEFMSSFTKWWRGFCSNDLDACSVMATSTAAVEMTTEEISTSMETVTGASTETATEESTGTVTESAEQTSTELQKETSTQKAEADAGRRKRRAAEADADTSNVIDVIMNVQSISDDKKKVAVDFAVTKGGVPLSPEKVKEIVKNNANSITAATNAATLYFDGFPTVAPPPSNSGLIAIIVVVIAVLVLVLVGLVIVLKRKQRADEMIGMSNRQGGDGSQYLGQRPVSQTFDNAAYNKSSETVRIGSFDKP